MSSYALDLVLEIGEDPPRARGAAHQDRPGSQSHVFGLRGRALDAADGLDEHAICVRALRQALTRRRFQCGFWMPRGLAVQG